MVHSIKEIQAAIKNHIAVDYWKCLTSEAQEVYHKVILSLFYKIYLILCVCACVHMHAHTFKYPRKPEGDIGPPHTRS